MTRSGYCYFDEFDDTSVSQYVSAFFPQVLKNSIRGARGQKFLKSLLIALEQMGKKELVAHRFASEDGNFCALGVLANAQAIDTSHFGDYYNCDPKLVAEAFDISPTLAKEIMYINDDDTLEHVTKVIELPGPILQHSSARSLTYSLVKKNENALYDRWVKVYSWVQSNITPTTKIQKVFYGSI